MSRITQTDVARHAGVSTAVVSYVVNRGPRPVAANTRTRVEAAIEELGYRPNASARALRLARTDVVGLVVPDITNPFFAEFAKVLQDAAFEAGRAVALANTDQDPDREYAQVSALLRRGVDGLIVFGIRSPGLLEYLTRTETTVVSMDHQFEQREISTVIADDAGAARAGVEHLLAHGRQVVAMIGGPSDRIAFDLRERAWRRALGESEAQILVRADATREGGYRAMCDLLDRVPSPDGVFVASDIQAMGALAACRDKGVRVPWDIAFVSLDGTREAAFAAPPLTTVRLPMDEMVREALSIFGAQPAEARHVRVGFDLVIRESCGCALTDGVSR